MIKPSEKKCDIIIIALLYTVTMYKPGSKFNVIKKIKTRMTTRLTIIGFSIIK